MNRFNFNSFHIYLINRHLRFTDIWIDTILLFTGIRLQSFCILYFGRSLILLWSFAARYQKTKTDVQALEHVDLICACMYVLNTPILYGVDWRLGNGIRTLGSYIFTKRYCQSKMKICARILRTRISNLTDIHGFHVSTLLCISLDISRLLQSKMQYNL